MSSDDEYYRRWRDKQFGNFFHDVSLQKILNEQKGFISGVTRELLPHVPNPSLYDAKKVLEEMKRTPAPSIAHQAADVTNTSSNKWLGFFRPKPASPEKPVNQETLKPKGKK